MSLVKSKGRGRERVKCFEGWRETFLGLSLVALGLLQFLVGSGCIGLGWVGLSWIDWIELGWVRLGCRHLHFSIITSS